MTILGLCFDSTTPGIPHHHDSGLVVLSFLIAALASFCSLDMAERMRAAEGRTRTFWLVMAGLTLGGGIWSMHFIAMTAFHVPIERGYDPALTLLSGLIAVAAVTAGLAVLGREPGPWRLLGSGVIVGTGVVAMHYMGMGALRISGEIAYRPEFFTASIVIALTAATVALWLAVNLTLFWQRAAAAVVMAIAISGMHYTGMTGVVLIAVPVAEPAEILVSKGVLAACVTIATGCFLAIALGLAFIDRRLEARERESQLLREINSDLEHARREAEAANRAKSVFLATMSHEIRTPMNGVLGMLDVTLRQHIDETVREHLSLARDSAANLLTILNDILDYSKLEAGQLQLERVSFCARQVADEVASMFAASIAQKKVWMDLSIDPALPPWIVGDPTRFRQILINLTSNALKFTDNGTITIVVSYLGGDAPHILRVEVRDTGIGIEEDVRARLFSRFSQADASTTRRYGGTGLGLAISRELIACMGGEIGVTSEIGKGSSFWFEIPTEAGAEPEVKAIDRSVAISGVRLRILVAEDNAVNQKVLRTLLSGQGHELHFVGDGSQAVEAARDGTFDIVLMDASMPVMDGLTATGVIRALPGAASRVPIIALTANAMAGDREIYLAAGMNDYVSKPVDLDLLLAAIARQAPGTARVIEAASIEPATPAAQTPTQDEAALAAVSANLDDLLAAFVTAPDKRDEAA